MKASKTMMKRATIVFCLLLTLLIWGGCGQTGSAQVEYVEYQSANGYTMQVPAAWTATEIDDRQTAFASADGSLSLTVSSELGSMEYYSLAEMGEAVAEELSATLLTEITDSGAVQTTNHAYLQRLNGPNADGDQLSLTLFIYQPYTAIRYYLVFVTSAAAYDDNLNMIQGVLDSFTVVLNEDELYQLTMDINTEAAEAAQKELEKQLEEEAQNAPSENAPTEETPTPETDAQ